MVRKPDVSIVHIYVPVPFVTKVPDTAFRECLNTIYVRFKIRSFNNYGKGGYFRRCLFLSNLCLTVLQLFRTSIDPHYVVGKHVTFRASQNTGRQYFYYNYRGVKIKSN